MTSNNPAPTSTMTTSEATEGLSPDSLPPLDSLKCDICKEYLNNPLTLACLHSFCTKCLLNAHGASEDQLEEFLAPPSTSENNAATSASTRSSSVSTAASLVAAANNNQNAGTQGAAASAAATPSSSSASMNNKGTKPVGGQLASSKHVDNSKPGDENEDGGEDEVRQPRRLTCPTCTNRLKIVPDEDEDPTEPFQNARLARIVRLVHETPVLCQNCKQSESEVKCSTCNAYCCRPCWQTTHGAPIFASHTGVPLRHSEMSALPKCPHHVLNDQEFFVTEEEVGACQVCLLKGDYVGAAYAIVTDVRSERQGEIEEGLNDLEEQRRRVVEGRESTLKALTDLHLNLEAAGEDVRANFAAIREALERREAETLKALQDLKGAKQKVLTSQVQMADAVVTRIDDAARQVNLILNHSNPLEVIYQTYVIQEHLARVVDVKSTAPKTCAECAKANLPCHHPAVDASLPVVLSDRVPQIVLAYAAVPTPSDVEAVAAGLKTESEILPQASSEQRKILSQVASSAESGGWDVGCTLF